MNATRRPLLLALLSLLAIGTLTAAQAEAQSTLPANTVRIHYHRTNGDYAGWAIYDWTGAKNPSPSWQNPGNPQTGTDDFGVYWDIALADGAPLLSLGAPSLLFTTTGMSSSLSSPLRIRNP